MFESAHRVSFLSRHVMIMAWHDHATWSREQKISTLKEQKTAEKCGWSTDTIHRKLSYHLKKRVAQITVQPPYPAASEADISASNPSIQMPPKSAFVWQNDIVFRFEHESQAASFAQKSIGARVGYHDKHNVHFAWPAKLRHVRVYPGKDVLNFVFNHQEDATRFHNNILKQGVEERSQDGSWRVYVPHRPF